MCCREDIQQYFILSWSVITKGRDVQQYNTLNAEREAIAPKTPMLEIYICIAREIHTRRRRHLW